MLCMFLCCNTSLLSHGGISSYKLSLQCVKDIHSLEMAGAAPVCSVEYPDSVHNSSKSLNSY